MLIISKIYHIPFFVGSPKVHTNLLWDLTLLFIVLAALYFFFIFFFKNKSSSIFIKRKNKRAELAPTISNFLFHSPEDPREEQKEYVELKIKIREYLANKHFRKILADILFDLQKDVAGGTRERLFRLFVELGLHHDSYKKLSSWRWNVVSQGILELSEMKVSDAFPFISKFINDKRGVVRKQAEIAVVLLKPDGINHLLSTTKYAISEWQQLRLIEALGNIENYRPPKFKAWLISHNEDVVLLSLRLIKHFNQNEAAGSIAELIKHKDDQVKIAAVSCVKDFNFTDAMDILKKIFWKCSTMVKVQILDAIGQIGDEGDLIFLYEIGKRESNFAVASKAYGAINTIAPDSILPTKNIVEDLVTPVDHSVIELYGIELLEIQVFYTEVNPEQEENIEVDEVEVYALVEETKNFDKKQTEEIINEPEFKIEEMEGELDKSLNDSLGLLDSKESNDDTDDLAEIQTNYSEMSAEERNKFVDTLESVGDKRETQLLEFIMENEQDTELRFRAFNTLKQVSVDATIVEPAFTAVKLESELEPESSSSIKILPEQSIFYELYQYASDHNSKEILIKEIIVIGDDKEVPFLEQLCETENGTIKDLAMKALKHINQSALNDTISTEKIEPKIDNQEAIVQNDIAEIDFNEIQSFADEPLATSPLSKENDDSRIPLELCFLFEELNINHSNSTKPDGFDFELSEEFHFEIAKANLDKKSVYEQ